MENSPDRKKTVGLLIGSLLLAALAAYGGYWYGTHNQPVVKKYYAPSNQAGADNWPKSIVTSQDATAVGKIINVEPNRITLEGDDGKQAVFYLSPYITINTLVASASAQLKVSHNPNDLQVGRKVAATLHLEENVYNVTTVNYLSK